MLKFENNYPLSKLTTLQIGGPAKKFVTVTTQEELIEAIRYAKNHQLPYLVIGEGSNLLVSDEEINKLIIQNRIAAISHPRGVILLVKSGTSLQNLVDYTIIHGLSGLQKLAGIPGTVGGAVYGNAGAYGQSISDHINKVSALNPAKLTIEQFNNPQCRFDYRDSIFKQNKYTLLEVTFKLENGDPETLRQEASEVLSKRLVKYPPGIRCPGSFFKNLIVSEIPSKILEKIPQDKIIYGKLPAGSLLEAVKAKGGSLDGIEISPNHANLFINRGGGTARAFCELAKMYALKVKEKFDITLEPEVQLINLPPLI